MPARVALVALALLAFSAMASLASRSPVPPLAPSVPEPRLARRFDRPPTEQEWRRFTQVQGQSRAEVIRILGHPAMLGASPEHRECWWYWYDGWIGVGFRDGRVDASGFGPQTACD
jgi:hypothetical protein